MTRNYSTREYREKLYDDLHVRLRDTVILMCAIFIASIGLNMNSTAVVIGAMRLMLYVDDEPGGVLFCVDFVGMFAVFEANNKLGLSFECAAGTHF